MNNFITNLCFFISIIFVCDIGFSTSAPERDQAIIYLSKYGYLDNIFESNQIEERSDVENAISDIQVYAEPEVTARRRSRPTQAPKTESAIEKALSEFQAYAGLEVTGELNEETIQKMSQPRCGVKDQIGTGNDYRSRRYALQGTSWRIKDLKYKVSKYPRKMSPKEVDETFAKAFGVWAEQTDLTFTATKDTANIDIRFETREHGDEGPFDGPGGKLAHAYFPVYGGNVHFDDSEKWSTDPGTGTHLLQVAAHEFGHALGLSHSDVHQALMKPFYDHFKSQVALEKDDIEAIQILYGKKEEKGPANNPTTPTSSEENISGDDAILCKDSKIDAIFTNDKEKTFVFKGQHYWQIDDDGIVAGYPKLISQRWPGLEGPIDAVFTFNNGKTFFFRGDRFWVYTGYTLNNGHPKKISSGFPGIPNNIDAAFVWSGNGKLYFFKGSKFWRFDPYGKPRKVKSNYPKKIANWNGVPDNIDAAFQYSNERTYFFKDDMHYRFNDTEFAVDSTGYPKSTKYWWFKCSNASSGPIGTVVYRGWNDSDDI